MAAKSNGSGVAKRVAGARVNKAHRAAPKSLSIAERGIKTGEDFASCYSMLIGDILANRVSVGVANAACSAGGKLLRIVELQHRMALQQGKSPRRALTLA